MVGVAACSLFGSPGPITTESAERIGIRPVINEARPAVQLAWPYHCVKRAPSAIIRSMFGVGAPRVSPPPNAPGSPQPMSSQKMTTTLGFFVWACAGATAHNSATVTISSDKPLVIGFLIVVLSSWVVFLFLAWVSSCSEVLLAKRSSLIQRRLQ